MSADPFQQITARLLRQVPPFRRPHLAKAAAGDRHALLLKAIDTWAGEMSAMVRGAKAEQAIVAKQLHEREAQSADLRRRINALERADALAARTAPPMPHPVAVSKADDIGGTDDIMKKRH